MQSAMAGGCGSGRWRRWSGTRTLPRLLALAALCFLTTCIGEADGTMDITAFEYFRKFGKHLELGECPQREIVIRRPNNTTITQPETCNSRQKGNVTNVPRELNDTRHVIIPSANDLVAYLGLCGGEAASYLGILNNAGDCVAVDIASRLSFNRKTLIRAYVEYYRKSLDILDFTSASSGSSPPVREGFSMYLADKFYVKNRSYGTLEIVLVQFRFKSRKETALAKEFRMTSNLMSDYMKKLEREVGKPKSIMVLSLSTATEENYSLKRYTEREWGSAVRDVEVRELTIVQRRALIDSGRIRPHLNYQLFPFVPKKTQSVRMSSPLTWEATSMLEVSLRVSIGIAKKTARRCRQNKTKLCRRVRELRRKLMSLQAEIHNGRSHWMELSTKEQQGFASRYTARVATFGSVTKRMSRDVRRMKKQEKLDRMNVKKRRRNQVPVQGRIRRVQSRRSRTHLHRLIRRRQQQAGGTSA